MGALDSLIPHAQRIESDSVDLALPLEQAWVAVRKGDLGSPLTRSLFALRTIPSQLRAKKRPRAPKLRLDQLVSTPEKPGFQVLIDHAPREIVVGAIGKVWRLDIPFRHVDTPAAFTAFDEPGWVKVGWALRLQALSENDTRVFLELRVDATDPVAWKKFTRYFRLAAAPSRFIRRTTLAALARKHGTPESKQNERPLAGDALLPDAAEQVTHSVLIDATPQEVWPWLVQMGCRRAGFYSIDTLDNGWSRSAREIHPELQALQVGDLVPATPRGKNGFEVLSVTPHRSLVLGGLFDATARRQLRFSTPRPHQFWQVTWALALEPVNGKTRLIARGRAAFPPSGRKHARWVRAAHAVMQTAQLAHVAARAEGRLPRDDWRDVAQGVAGAAVIAGALVTPMLRRARNHWGLEKAQGRRRLPGDALIVDASWSWTHGIEIDAPPAEVWPWIAQLGADRGGFYSYQWLENVAGSRLRNAETVRPDWALREGDALRLHPKLPPLQITELRAGHHLVAYAAPGEDARMTGKRWLEASWLLYVEPLGDKRSRLISRYRCGLADDLKTRLQFGPSLLEPIGFAMDRQLLRGVKQRAEQSTRGGGRPPLLRS